jgi:hypothetical protein
LIDPGIFISTGELFVLKGSNLKGENMPVTIERKSKKTGIVSKKIYETVAERVRKFRDTCSIVEGWALRTKIDFPNEKMVVAVAQVLNPQESVVATGTAEEVRDANDINRTSAVENAETSAIGRCLFAAGFGGGEFCSADELLTALKRQEQIKEQELKVLEGGGNDQPPKPESSEPTPQSTPSKPAEILGPRLKGVTYRREGNFIIAEGNTFPVKGLLDTAGFKWTPSFKAMAKEVAA